jgi:uncharacterized membrane protein
MVSQLENLNQPTQGKRKQLVTKPWRFLLVAVLAIGIIFRFANLDGKVYWFDENATIFKISGYTIEEWDSVKNKLNGQIISIKDFQKSYSPNSQSNVIDTIELLALQDSKHTPLYFAILRLWVDLFGNSAAVMRSLSALISLLIFPCLYWLCLELFQSPLVGWIAVALIAVSPFHVLYAQEVRPYSLLAVTILLSSAALLRAIRLKTKLSWGLYILSWSLSIYTHTLSLFVFIAHGIYVLATYGIRRSKVSIAYLIATLVGVLTFTPWLFFIVTNYDRVSESLEWQTNKSLPFSSLVIYWIIYLSRIFLDLNPSWQLDTDLSSFQNPLSLFLITILLALVVYSIYFLCRSTPIRIWLFIVILIGIPALAILLPDLVFGGIRSSAARYLIASYLGIHLAVAYLLGTKIASSSSSIWTQKLWQIATVIIISGGILSGAIISPAETWWNKYPYEEIPQIAKIINQANSPLLLIDKQGRRDGWSISNFLEPKVQVELLNEPNIIKVPDEFSDVFLFNPAEEWQARLAQKQKFKMKPIYKKTFSLWRLEN